MLLSLGHVTVRSTDFDRTERFYSGLLGLRPGPRPDLGLPGRWYYLGDDAVLHVLAAAGHAEAARQPIDHFAFKATDMPAVEQRLRAAGQAFVVHPLPGTTVLQLFLTDPDGARVELSFDQA
jgi:catechol 2,3-dioxygenase-like lactoylglutathione lyase family enzyme